MLGTTTRVETRPLAHPLNTISARVHLRLSATKESERGSADELDGRDVVKELAVLAQPTEEQ